MEQTGSSGSTPRSVRSLPLPPGWRLERDAPCPACRYNLRGLHDPRCPECGKSFQWQEILEATCPRCGESLSRCDTDACPNCKLTLDWPALLDSAYVIRRELYEYSNRPLRAAVGTIFAVMLPARFWRGFQLEMPPQLDRLGSYRRRMYAVALIGLLPMLAVRLAQQFLPGAFIGPAWLPERWLLLLGLVLGVPLLVSIALPRFTPTLTKFRIRDDQISRCVTYLATFALWVGLIALLAFAWDTILSALQWSRGFRRAWPFLYVLDFEPLAGLPTLQPEPRWASWRKPNEAELALNLLVVGGAVWSIVFQYFALRRYLRLARRDAFALTICTQLLAYVAILTACAVFALVYLAIRIGY